MIQKEIKIMSEKELAIRMINYIDRIKSLMDRVSVCIDKRLKRVDKDSIRNEYKNIKDDIKKDAHYVDLVRNKNYENILYSNFFVPSIAEASAYGFAVSTNCSIDFKLYSSLSEAHYKLTKYYSYEKWKKLSKQ